MKKFALIPARYDSSRFPGKLMKILGDKTIIRHTYENTVATQLFDDVFVATDSPIIYDEIVSNGGKAVMSKRAHESGSDRIAEAIADMDVDIVLNVQGDEPFVQKEPLQKLLQAFEGENGKSVQVASLMRRFTDAEMVKEASNVKVVVDLHNNSLLFSRSVIPFARDTQLDIPYYHHVGVYAFRKQALMNFTEWEMTPLEAAEKIECLRYLEHGIQLKMVLIEAMGIGIDTPEDLERAKKKLMEL